MITKIKIEKEVDLKTLHVEAGVRYWQDSEVNGVEDTENGSKIPCKHGELWKPEIDIETGQIINWQKGKTANIHYKVCDCCSWCFKDVEGNVYLEVKNEYVPDSLCPADSGYGDYIIMNIDENGFIEDWNFNIEDFVTDED